MTKRSWNAIDRLAAFDLALPERVPIVPTKCYDLWDLTPEYYGRMLSAYARETQYEMWLKDPESNPQLPLDPFGFLLSNYSEDNPVGFRECENDEKEKEPIYIGLGFLALAAGLVTGFSVGQNYGLLAQLSLPLTNGVHILDCIGQVYLNPRTIYNAFGGIVNPVIGAIAPTQAMNDWRLVLRFNECFNTMNRSFGQPIKFFDTLRTSNFTYTPLLPSTGTTLDLVVERTGFPVSPSYTDYQGLVLEFPSLPSTRDTMAFRSMEVVEWIPL